MGPLSTCLSKSLPEIRNLNSRFIRFKGVTPSSTMCCMETRSLQHSDGRNANSLDTGSLLRISPILSDPSCTKQNTTRPSTHSHVDNTFLVNIIVVSTSVGNTNKETNSNTSFNHTFSRSKREHHPLVLNKTLMLVAWQVSWRYYLSRYFLRKQPSLFLSQEVKGLVNIVH